MASIDSMFLIYQDNRAILKGKRRKLARRQEVRDNLAVALGIRESPVDPGCGGCLGGGCAGIMGLGFATVGAVVGMILLVVPLMGFISTLRTRSLSPEDIPISILMLSVGMFYVGVFGYRYLLQAYLAMRYPAYIQRRYQQLIEQGEIVEGTIVSIEEPIEQIIHYRFDVPSRCETCEGQYHLFTQTTLVPGQKLTILYLNRCIHVPL